MEKAPLARQSDFYLDLLGNPEIKGPSKIAQQTDFGGWKEEKRYGDRWAVESAYSCIKRIFGEYVSAKKFVNMAKEMTTKVSLYNLFMQMIPHGGG